VGLLLRSLYEPEVATVASVGVPIRSEYVPVLAILCNVIEPLKASEALVDCAVVAVVFKVPGALGIVGLFDKSV